MNLTLCDKWERHERHRSYPAPQPILCGEIVVGSWDRFPDKRGGYPNRQDVKATVNDPEVQQILEDFVAEKKREIEEKNRRKMFRISREAKDEEEKTRKAVREALGLSPDTKPVPVAQEHTTAEPPRQSSLFAVLVWLVGIAVGLSILIAGSMVLAFAASF